LYDVKSGPDEFACASRKGLLCVNQLFTEPYMPCQSRSDFVSTLLNKSDFISLVSLQEHASWRIEISWILFTDISRLYLSFFIDIFIVFFHSIVDTTSNEKHLRISLFFFLFKEKQKKIYLINTTLLIQNLNIARKLLILQDSIMHKMCIKFYYFSGVKDSSFSSYRSSNRCFAISRVIACFIARFSRYDREYRSRHRRGL